MPNGLKKKSHIIEEAWRFRTGGIPARHRALPSIRAAAKKPIFALPIVPPVIKQAARQVDVVLGTVAGAWASLQRAQAASGYGRKRPEERGILKGKVGTKQWEDLLRALRR